MKTLLIIMIYALPLNVFARLDETPTESQRRYGKPLSVDKEDNSIVFKKAGFYIIINYWKGKAHRLNFSKVKQNAIGNSVKMTDTEIQALMKANAKGYSWEKSKAISMDDYWKRSDDKALAAHKTLDHMLVIATHSYAAHKANEKSAKEKDNIKGF